MSRKSIENFVVRFGTPLVNAFFGSLILTGGFSAWTGKALAAPFAYVNLYSGTVFIIDTATNSLMPTTISTAYGSRGIAVNATGARAYVVGGEGSPVGTLSVIDTCSKTVITTVPVGSGGFGVAVNPAGTRVYVANQADATVSIIDGGTNSVIKTLPVAGPPLGLAAHPSGELVYVTLLSSPGTVAVIATSSNTVIDTIQVGRSPVGIIVNPAGTRAYVANQGDSTVSVIDTGVDTVIKTIPVGTGPTGVAVNLAGTRVYVTNQSDATVSVIDTSTNDVIATPSVGEGPVGVAVTPSGSEVYVVNDNAFAGSVSVIDALTNSVTTTISLASFPQGFGQFIPPPPSIPNVALLAPVQQGLRLTVIHGYNDPPYRTTDLLVCTIGSPPDHCRNQQFGLDLQPGAGWDGQILAPAPGTPRRQVKGAGGSCLLFDLDDGTSLTICHFSTIAVKLRRPVGRGTVLGMASSTWIHLSLDGRPNTLCNGGWQVARGQSPYYYCPKQFISPHSFEGINLPANGSQNEYWNTTYCSTNH